MSPGSVGSIQLVPMTEASAAAGAAASKRAAQHKANALESDSDSGQVGRDVYAPEPPPPLLSSTGPDGASLETVDWKGDPIVFSPGDRIPFKF